MFKKGEIYLAKLNPKKSDEIGKIRPVLIYQTNLLNDCGHTTTIVLPISTFLIDDSYPLRYRIEKRDNLEKESDILCDQIRALDNQRIIPKVLTKLSLQEILEIDKQVSTILECE